MRELLPRRLKTALKRLVRLPDRWLHPWRRRRARRELARVARGADSIVFVCYGNICRSPFAARLFEDALPPAGGDELAVASTGFYPGEGRASPPEAVRAARQFGIDLSDHRSRSLRSGSATAAGASDPVVFVMTPRQRRKWRRDVDADASRVFVLADFDPAAVEARGIRDPFGQPDPVFDAVFARIERCVRELAPVLVTKEIGSEREEVA